MAIEWAEKYDAERERSRRGWVAGLAVGGSRMGVFAMQVPAEKFCRSYAAFLIMPQ